MVASPTAARIAADLGFKRVYELDHGQEMTVADGRLHIRATAGKLLSCKMWLSEGSTVLCRHSSAICVGPQARWWVHHGPRGSTQPLYPRCCQETPDVQEGGSCGKKGLQCCAGMGFFLQSSWTAASASTTNPTASAGPPHNTAGLLPLWNCSAAQVIRRALSQ